MPKPLDFEAEYEFELEGGGVIARHIDVNSVVWTLIDNGKLANQIARLVAIVVRSKID